MFNKNGVEVGKSKRIFAIITVFAAAIAFYSSNTLVPNFYLNRGITAYLDHDYETAYSNLKIAVKLNSNKPDSRYYFVQTLIKLPPTLAVQKTLYELSQENLPDSADLIADRQIEKWKQIIISNIGENYIEQVPYNNKILRWDVSKFPLRVYVHNDSKTAPTYYNKNIAKAFLQWGSSTAGLIKFRFVDSLSDADIVVNVVSAAKNNCSEANCKYVVAYTSPIVKGDLLKRMDVTFYDSNNLAKPFSAREIYNTALHEIGHALGIMGHSYNKDDLMYMENDVDETFDKFRSDFQLISSTDLNTLDLLYKLIPDITNTELSKFDSRGQFFAPIVMGTDAQINSRKLLEAQNYIESAPNLPNGYIDLAAAYAEQHEYNRAIDSLEKALGLSISDDEKVVVYYNLAVVYMDIQDWDTSLTYANMAKSVKPSAEIDGLIAGINFNRGNKKFAKNAYIQTVEKNPQSVIDSVNLAKIYIREFNFVAAGKTLNNLVKANPQAKNDSRLKVYSLLMFFFK